MCLLEKLDLLLLHSFLQELSIPDPPPQLSPLPACLPGRQRQHEHSQLPKHTGLGLHFSVSQATSRNLVIAIFHVFYSVFLVVFFFISPKSQLPRSWL